MYVKEVIDFLEKIAPLSIQEEYDNSGLLVGDSKTRLNGVLISLDCTEQIINEAIKNNCNLIIIHHPLIFNPIKKINGKTSNEKVIISAIKKDICIYSMHTNFDNILNGVNFIIAKKLNLKKLKILRHKKNTLSKLELYCPKEFTEKVRNSIFLVGGGKIGEYNSCSFNISGKGTFKPSRNANPFIGQKDEFKVEDEDKIELVFPSYLENKIIDTLKNNHPYEQVAFQVIQLSNPHPEIGSGLVGELDDEIRSDEFLRLLKDKMNTNSIKYTKLVRKKIKKIALCGGSGSFLINDAILSNADLFISSDIKYHDFFKADNKIIIADIGHYESEQFTKDLIFDLLNKNFNRFAILKSKINTNPVNYL